MALPGAIAAAALTAALLAACGSATSAQAQPWRASHPDPAGLSFDETAPGLCALPVQFPAEAPAAVQYQGATYVQTARVAAPAAPPGTVIARSGDWTVSAAGGDVYVLTGAAMYQYRSETNC